MLPNWDKDITVFIRTEQNNTVQWEKRCFSHCFFKHHRSSEFDDKSRIVGESFLVRIPCKVSFEIPCGSIAVLGFVDDEIAENASGNDVLRKYGEAFKVNTFCDNTGVYLPHIRIGN